MIEKIVADYLESQLNVPVLMEKPIKKIAEYVTIQKTGSSGNNYIQNATLAIQSWSDSLYHAAELNEKVKEAMIGNQSDSYGIIELDEISKCELNSDYEFTDTATKSYRYQAVYDLVF